jgi:hypothetical protein
MRGEMSDYEGVFLFVGELLSFDFDGVVDGGVFSDDGLSDDAFPLSVNGAVMALSDAFPDPSESPELEPSDPLFDSLVESAVPDVLADPPLRLSVL